jgi:hypothetical protein
MTLRRVVGSVAVLAAGLLGLSACSSGKPSGLAPFTPGATSTSSSPSPTSTSKWTPEQQQVIEAYVMYQALITKYRKGAKLDMAALRSVATEAFAVKSGKEVAAGLSAGFILHGDDVHDTRVVTIAGTKSILTECWDTKSYGVNEKASPPITAKGAPPANYTVNLTRSADTWHVAGFTRGAACSVNG